MSNEVQSNKSGLNRRELLTGTGVVGAGLLVSAALPSRADAANGHNHHGGQMMPQGAAMNNMPLMNQVSPNMQLMQSAQNCLVTANVCVNHCISLISQGDPSLRDCLRTASEMIPSCNTLGQLASMNAKRLKEFAEFCIIVCTDCEMECRKHQSHHWQCKNCAEACAECIKQCKMLLAA
jgi:Cys-rich four helix bundle protein (predicted Tat secretion target)